MPLDVSFTTAPPPGEASSSPAYLGFADSPAITLRPAPGTNEVECLRHRPLYPPLTVHYTPTESTAALGNALVADPTTVEGLQGDLMSDAPAGEALARTVLLWRVEYADDWMDPLPGLTRPSLLRSAAHIPVSKCQQCSSALHFLVFRRRMSTAPNAVRRPSGAGASCYGVPIAGMIHSATPTTTRATLSRLHTLAERDGELIDMSSGATPTAAKAIPPSSSTMSDTPMPDASPNKAPRLEDAANGNSNSSMAAPPLRKSNSLMEFERSNASLQTDASNQSAHTASPTLGGRRHSSSAAAAAAAVRGEDSRSAQGLGMISEGEATTQSQSEFTNPGTTNSNHATPATPATGHSPWLDETTQLPSNVHLYATQLTEKEFPPIAYGSLGRNARRVFSVSLACTSYHHSGRRFRIAVQLVGLDSTGKIALLAEGRSPAVRVVSKFLDRATYHRFDQPLPSLPTSNTTSNSAGGGGGSGGAPSLGFTGVTGTPPMAHTMLPRGASSMTSSSVTTSASTSQGSSPRGQGTSPPTSFASGQRAPVNAPAENYKGQPLSTSGGDSESSRQRPPKRFRLDANQWMTTGGGSPQLVQPGWEDSNDGGNSRGGGGEYSNSGTPHSHGQRNISDPQLHTMKRRGSHQQLDYPSPRVASYPPGPLGGGGGGSPGSIGGAGILLPPPHALLSAARHQHELEAAAQQQQAYFAAATAARDPVRDAFQPGCGSGLAPCRGHDCTAELRRAQQEIIALRYRLAALEGQSQQQQRFKPEM